MSLRGKILAMSTFALAISDVSFGRSNEGFGFGMAYKDLYPRKRETRTKKSPLTKKQKKARAKSKAAKQARKINYKNKSTEKLKNKQYEFKDTYTKFKVIHH